MQQPTPFGGLFVRSLEIVWVVTKIVWAMAEVIWALQTMSGGFARIAERCGIDELS